MWSEITNLPEPELTEQLENIVAIQHEMNQHYVDTINVDHFKNKLERKEGYQIHFYKDDAYEVVLCVWKKGIDGVDRLHVCTSGMRRSADGYSVDGGVLIALKKLKELMIAYGVTTAYGKWLNENFEPIGSMYYMRCSSPDMVQEAGLSRIETVRQKDNTNTWYL